MFWRKKEEKRLPDLPPADYSMSVLSKRLDDFDEFDESEEKHVLPSFPDTPSHNRFSEAAIKDAVNEDSEELPEIPKSSENKVIEMEEWKPSRSIRSLENPLPMLRPKQVMKRESFEPSMIGQEMKMLDVFVKIDKFRSAKKAIREVKSRLEDIDVLLSKIREVKLREDQELKAWENELIQIKARVQDIHENIFEKVD